MLGLENELNIKINISHNLTRIDDKKVETKLLSTFKQRVTKFKEEQIENDELQKQVYDHIMN